MDSKLLSCGKLEIPEALALDHEQLRGGLMRAAKTPGRLGEAAGRVAGLCFPHFAQEEENIFRAFGMLHDLASGRVDSETAAVARKIAQFSARHLALRYQHQSIDAAVEVLLREARKEDNEEIPELVNDLRAHEKIEDEMMYPTVLMIGKSARGSLLS
jgi:hypothetical protein